MDTVKSDKSSLDANESNWLGLEERRMLLAVTGPQPRLDYPTKMLNMLNGAVVEQYIIPDADKEKVFNDLYPFENKPGMDSRMLDIHAEKRFMLKDFIVIREGDGNFLVSPYYAEAGGTVLDWMPASQLKTTQSSQKEEGARKDQEQHPQDTF